PPRAPRGGADRRAGPRGGPHPPGTRADRLLPRDAGHGRGVRRRQRGAGLRPRGRSTPGRPAPGGDGAPRQPRQVGTGRARADGRALTTTSTAPQPRFSARSVDLAVLLGLIALAAAMRLPDLATRGTWDADQGHDMLVLRA